jgi:hypothetical protein
MTRPGRRLRALYVRWCSDRTRQRLIDPAVSDLQVEYEQARRSGSRMRAAWALVGGYAAVAKTIFFGCVDELATELQVWRTEELEGFRRAARAGAVLLTLGTALLVTPTLHAVVWPVEQLDWGARSQLAVYLIPSALVLSAPYSLALAVAWMLCGAARTPKVAAAGFAVATALSAATFVNLVWLTPEANQLFRERAYAAIAPDAPAPPAPGLHELTWTETRQRRVEVHARADAREIRMFETWHHRRFAISLAPLALVALVVALAFRRSWTRAGLTSTALAACATNYMLLMWGLWAGRRGSVPPVVGGWSADAVCALAAVAVTCVPRRRRASAPPVDLTR